MMFAHSQPAKLGSRLLLILMGLAWVLTACNNESVPELPISDQGGFEFQVDPQSQTVTLIENERFPSNLQQQYLPSDTRILVPDVDISLENYHYVFHRGNKLIIQTRFRNVTEDAEFLQPFFFTLNADTNNIKSATAPLVLDKDLGGDGVLSPQEKTSRLTFEVIHKGKPFSFFVDVSAVVKQVGPSVVKLTASDGVEGDRFGWSLAVSNDTLVVGAPRVGDVEGGDPFGRAYVFEKRNGSWQETSQLTPIDETEDFFFGRSVAISGDVIIVSDNGGDANAFTVHVFEKHAGRWDRVARLAPAESALMPFWYTEVSLAIEGDTFVVGALQRFTDSLDARAWVFEKQDDVWHEVSELNNGSQLGLSVAISDGVIAVGAATSGYQNVAPYVFEKLGGSWQEVARLPIPTDAELNSQTLAMTTGLVVGLGEFGFNGGTSQGLFAFEQQNSDWQEPIIVPIDSNRVRFPSVAIDGGLVVVGAPFVDEVEAFPGCAIVFEKRDGTWQEVTKLTPFDGRETDWFGRSVGISGNTIVVGASFSDDLAPNSGSVYGYYVP